jgi:adenine-specific DNA methylase
MERAAPVIPRECKRLAEVDFPLKIVGQESSKERYGAGGHPFLLHLWWARRPLAACRAIMLALLFPDPCDPHCPAEFKLKARELLPPLMGTIRADDAAVREKLLSFISRLANRKLSTDFNWLSVARGLIRAAYPEEAPLVVDPFSGGGSIPLEGLRLGCDVTASDLNPVACINLKALLEEIPRGGQHLAPQLRAMAKEIGDSTQQELGALYPPDPDGAQPIAYLWARTVRCETPDCGAEVPIFRSGWLAKRGVSNAKYMEEDFQGRNVALVIEAAPRGGPITFRIVRGIGRERPAPGLIEIRGTKTPGNNASVRCPCCDTVLPGSRTNPRTVIQLREQHGGAEVHFDESGRRLSGAFLLAVVTRKPANAGQQYRLPTQYDYDTLWNADKVLRNWQAAFDNSRLTPFPNEPLPAEGTLGFRVQRYGMTIWSDLFTGRQRLITACLVEKIARVQQTALQHLLALALDRVAMSNMSLTRWNASAEKMQHTFGRQALPIVWDFAELCPLADAPGSWTGAVELISDVIISSSISTPGDVSVSDARNSSLPDGSAGIWFTDPPYYDAVPYADLSDFFFVWLKRALPDNPLLLDPDDPGNPLTPKIAEIIQDRSKNVGNEPKDKSFFERSMARAFNEGRRIIQEDGIGCVIFAHKTTEGWEALLSGITKGGWIVTGSWPIATEMGTRLRARDSAALATSVHLVCRPRTKDRIGDWADVLRELPERVGEWMTRLEGQGIRGADLVFACIGPALEIFSQFSRVEAPDGREVLLPEYLQKVWEVVGRTALAQVLGTAEAQAQNGGAGALEEDARLTTLFLWTHRSTAGNGVDTDSDDDAEDQSDDEEAQENGDDRKAAKGLKLIFDIVRRFAQPLGIRLDAWEGRIIETEKDVVRLLPVSERARQLFGSAGVAGLADRIERMPAAAGQLELFPELHEAEEARPRGRRSRFAAATAHSVVTQATTLDRVHTAMLLQASGRTNGLRNLLAAEQERGPDFLRLSQCLIPLYPEGHEERRLLEAMMLAAPR